MSNTLHLVRSYFLKIYLLEGAVVLPVAAASLTVLHITNLHQRAFIVFLKPCRQSGEDSFLSFSTAQSKCGEKRMAEPR